MTENRAPGDEYPTRCNLLVINAHYTSPRESLIGGLLRESN